MLSNKYLILGLSRVSDLDAITQKSLETVYLGKIAELKIIENLPTLCCSYSNNSHVNGAFHSLPKLYSSEGKWNLSTSVSRFWEVPFVTNDKRKVRRHGNSKKVTKRGFLLNKF